MQVSNESNTDKKDEPDMSAFYTNGKLHTHEKSIELTRVLFNTGAQRYNFISKSFVDENRLELQQYMEKLTNPDCSVLLGEFFTIFNIIIHLL